METSGEHDTISLQSILQGFIHFKTQDNDTAWGATRDRRNINYVEFSDPHRLNSVLMFNGAELGLDALASYLTDSFCKGFIQLKHVFQDTIAFKEVDTMELLKQLNDLELRLFGSVPTLINYSIKKEMAKTGMDIKTIDHSTEYAIIPKSYSALDETFKPATFNA